MIFVWRLNTHVGICTYKSVEYLDTKCVDEYLNEPKNLNLEQISSIIDYFSLQKHLKYNIPSFKSRTASHTHNTDDQLHFRRLTNMIRDIICKLSITLIPGPSKEIVLQEVLSTMSSDINLRKQKYDANNSMNSNDELNNIRKIDTVSTVRDREKFEKLANSLCIAQKYLKR